MNDKFQGLLGNPIFMSGMGLLGGQGISGGLEGLKTSAAYKQQFDELEKKRKADELKQQYLQKFQTAMGADGVNDINKVAQSLMSTSSPEMAMQGARLSAQGMPGQESFFAPTMVTGPDDSVQFIQASNRGGVPQVLEGWTPFKPDKVVDLHDKKVLIDQITGEKTEMDKDFANPEFEKVTGKSEAEKKVSAPMRMLRIETAEETINDMMNIPGMDGFTGAGQEFNALLSRAGTSRADFKAIRESVMDQVLMIEFDALRGTGSITEAEAERAQRAATALSPEMSDAMFVRQVNKLKNRLKRLKEATKKDMQAGENPEASAGADIDAEIKALEAELFGG